MHNPISFLPSNEIKNMHTSFRLEKDKNNAKVESLKQSFANQMAQAVEQRLLYPTEQMSTLQTNIKSTTTDKQKSKKPPHLTLNIGKDDNAVKQNIQPLPRSQHLQNGAFFQAQDELFGIKTKALFTDNADYKENKQAWMANNANRKASRPKHLNTNFTVVANNEQTGQFFKKIALSNAPHQASYLFDARDRKLIGQASWLQQAKNKEHTTYQEKNIRNKTRLLRQNNAAQSTKMHSRIAHSSFSKSLNDKFSLDKKPFNLFEQTKDPHCLARQQSNHPIHPISVKEDPTFSKHLLWDGNALNTENQSGINQGGRTPTNHFVGHLFEINTPLNSTQWGQQFGQNTLRLVQSLNQGTHTAELRLDPPHLGPLQVTLQLNKDQVLAQFYSPHVMVRQSIEQALPQLIEQFAQAGINLSQTDISDQTPSWQPPFRQETEQSPNNSKQQAQHQNATKNTSKENTSTQ